LRRQIKPEMITPSRVADADKYLRLILEAIDAHLPVFVRSTYTNRFALFDEVLESPPNTDDGARALFFALQLALKLFQEHAIDDARSGDTAMAFAGVLPLLADLGLMTVTREEIKPDDPDYLEMMESGKMPPLSRRQ
jgi:hypothetical protein